MCAMDRKKKGIGLNTALINDMKLYLPEIFDLGVFHGSRRFIDITQSGILTSGIYIFFGPKNLFLILTEISLMCEKINNNPEKKAKHTFQAPSGRCTRHRISCPCAGAPDLVKGGQDLCSLCHCRHLHHLGCARKENNIRVLLTAEGI